MRLPIGLLLFMTLLGSSVHADWKEDWDKATRAAKQEGSFVVYTSPGKERLFQEFHKKFPEIKPVEVSVQGAARINRILAERRAEKYLADLLIAGAGTAAAGLLKGNVLDPIKPALLLPEVLDQNKWWQGKHIYGDDDKKYIFAFGGAPTFNFFYNTNLVDPKEFKSYWDFVNPKWKGKILIAEPLSAGTPDMIQFLYYHREIGPNFLKRLLTDMDVAVSRDIRQMVDWVAQGKFAIGALQSVERLDVWAAKQRGLPVEIFLTDRFKEGGMVGSAGGNLMLVNRAPHPNAAKVFINWLLSREGQIAYQKYFETGGNSLRIDIPKNEVAEHLRITPGLKYVLTDDPAYADLEPVRKFIGEVWKPSK